MPGITSVISPEGQAGTVPSENLSEALAAGFRVAPEPGNIDLDNRPIVKNEDGSVSTVRSMSFNEDGKEVLVPTVSADGKRILSDAEAIKQYHDTGKHLGKFSSPEEATAYAQQLHRDQEAKYAPHGDAPKDDVQVVSPEGTRGTVPSDNLEAALKEGFKRVSPEELELEKHPVQSAIIAAGHGIGEALPDVVKDLLGGEETPERKAVEEAAVAQHPSIATGAHVAAEVAPALSGLGSLGGIAEGAGKAILEGGTREVVEAASSKALQAGAKKLGEAGLETLADEFVSAGPSVARQVAAGAVEQGIRGALVSTPEAAKQLFNGDPKRAGEALLWGAGTGMLLGGLGPVTKAGASKVAEAAEDFAEYVSKLDPSKVAQKGAKYVGGAVGATLGGIVGHPTAGAVIGSNIASDLANTAFKKTGDQVARAALKAAAGTASFGSVLASQALSSAGQQLSKVADAISAAEADRGEPQRTTPKEAAQVARVAQRYTADPQQLVEDAVRITDPIVHDQATRAVAQQLQATIARAVSYIVAVAPKPPPPSPFTKNDWQPSLLQLAPIRAAVDVLRDPYCIVHGQATQDHIDACQAIYPQTLADIREAIVTLAASPDAPRLNSQQRQKLSNVLGAPIDPLQRPDNAQALQASFQGGPEDGGQGPQAAPGNAGGSKGRLSKLDYKKLPNSLPMGDRLDGK